MLTEVFSIISRFPSSVKNVSVSSGYDALALTKHHTATAIVAAIFVLVDRSVTGVGIDVYKRQMM